MRFRQPSVIPGFGLALGVTLAWLTIIVLIPLSGLLWRSSGLGWSKFVELALDERTVNALTISFGTAFIAAVSTWSSRAPRLGSVRIVPRKRVIDAMVDLPFALPTAVAGHCAHDALCAERLDRLAPRSARH